MKERSFEKLSSCFVSMQNTSATDVGQTLKRKCTVNVQKKKINSHKLLKIKA